MKPIEWLILIGAALVFWSWMRSGVSANFGGSLTPGMNGYGVTPGGFGPGLLYSGGPSLVSGPFAYPGGNALNFGFGGRNFGLNFGSSF